MLLTSDRLINKFSDYNCILAYETAAEFLGLFVGYAINNKADEIFVLEEKPINNTKQYLIQNFNNKDYFEKNGIYCTTEEQTLIDLVDQDGDIQVILESLADYYFRHNNSFDGIDVPPVLSERFNKYCEWAIDYYNEWGLITKKEWELMQLKYPSID